MTVLNRIQSVQDRANVRLLSGLAVALLLLLPFSPLSDFYVHIPALILIWILLTVSLNLLVGYLGTASFAHGMLFGVGTYGVSILTVEAGVPMWASIFACAFAATLIALFIALPSLRLVGIYFAIITLAIAQLFYQLSINWTSLTGGTSGLQGIPAVKLFGSTIADTVPFYYLTLIAVVVAYALSVRLLESPFGRIMVAIREGERRTAFLGYDTTLYKRRALAFSGGIAGLAGVLYAGAQGFVTPNALHWTISGDALFGVILGGMGTLFGPLVGGAIYAGLQQVLSSYIDEWRFVIGLLLVLSVMFAPRGLVSIYAGVADWIDGRCRRAP